MPLQAQEQSVESICTILSCDSAQFFEFYNSQYTTDLLSEDALKHLKRYREGLRSASNRYKLYEFLYGMINYAPHPLGKRYVSIAVLIATRKGEDAVIAVAQAWFENLFFPMLAKSRELLKAQLSGSQTPTIEPTAELIESATPRSDQASLRRKVALRERYFCAVTKAFDDARAEELLNAGRGGEIPKGYKALMNVAHIIPFSLNDFNDKAREAAHTWDMLRAWTQIDIKQLVVGTKINSPANAIYMSKYDHSKFGQFQFYLDKEDYPDTPNKYKVQMTRSLDTLSNGQSDPDVEFSATERGIEPPDPEFLKVHAAFARVLNLSGAVEYFDRIERDVERNDLFSTPEGWDSFASILALRTGIMVDR